MSCGDRANAFAVDNVGDEGASVVHTRQLGLRTMVRVATKVKRKVLGDGPHISALGVWAEVRGSQPVLGCRGGEGDVLLDAGEVSPSSIGILQQTDPSRPESCDPFGLTNWVLRFHDVPVDMNWMSVRESTGRAAFFVPVTFSSSEISARGSCGCWAVC
jgi:hypothetical protein